MQKWQRKQGIRASFLLESYPYRKLPQFLKLSKRKFLYKAQCALVFPGIAIFLLSSLSVLTSCGEKYMNPPSINGVSLQEFTIVYDFEGVDYNKRAAEYIKNTAKVTSYFLLILETDSNSKHLNSYFYMNVIEDGFDCYKLIQK